MYGEPVLVPLLPPGLAGGGRPLPHSFSVVLLLFAGHALVRVTYVQQGARSGQGQPRGACWGPANEGLLKLSSADAGWPG